MQAVGPSEHVLALHANHKKTRSLYTLHCPHHLLSDIPHHTNPTTNLTTSSKNLTNDRHPTHPALRRQTPSFENREITNFFISISLQTEPPAYFIMAKTLSGCRICVISPRTWSSKKWTREQIEKWVKQAGGAFHKEFEKESTTHLVVEEQVWKNKTMAVQIALEAIDNGRKVYIVTPQWLEDCLTTQKKLREREFLWERIDQEAAGDQRKKRGKQAGEGEGEDGGEDGEGGARSHQAMLGEVLQEGTEEYVGDHDRRVFEAENAQRQRAEKELQELEARRKEQEKQALKEQRKVHSDLMKKTAKGGRGDVFKG
jgi:tRNA U38,U39,U40 pseudouridine synthase TruA